jgi:hypothetical protein
VLEDASPNNAKGNRSAVMNANAAYVIIVHIKPVIVSLEYLRVFFSACAVVILHFILGLPV